MTRAERATEALRLRREGLLYREIAERMGISIQYVGELCTDPDGAAVRARKDSYRGTCQQCGGPTDGSNGAEKASTLCADCIAWTPDEVLASFRTFKRVHGRSPTEVDARSGGPGWGFLPHGDTTKRLFGGWNKALLAAGLALNMDRRPETQAAIEAAIARGERVAEIAARYGCTPENIYRRLRVRGLSIHELRGKVAA